MANAASQTSDRVQSSDVRFSIRTLLYITVAVALVAALAGQFVRGLEHGQQSRVVVAWASWLFVVVGWIVYFAERRIRAEKLAGRTIVRLPIYGMNPWWRVISRFLLCIYLAHLGVISLYVIAQRAADARSLPAALLVGIYPDVIALAWLAALSVALWWGGRDIRLSEAGVLWDRRLIRWMEVEPRWDPDRDGLTLRGLDQRGRKLTCDVVVPEEQRSAVEALLREKLPASADRGD